MKTIQWSLRLLFRRRTKTKNPEPCVPENALASQNENARKPEQIPPPDDDSPPGYKIRWHQ